MSSAWVQRRSKMTNGCMRLVIKEDNVYKVNRSADLMAAEHHLNPNPNPEHNPNLNPSYITRHRPC